MNFCVPFPGRAKVRAFLSPNVMCGGGWVPFGLFLSYRVKRLIAELCVLRSNAKSAEVEHLQDKTLSLGALHLDDV